MARFRLTMATTTSQWHYAAGDIITDIQPVSVAGDKFFPGLSSGTLPQGCVPLDGPSSSVKAASAYANEIIPCCITGANSIQA